MYGLTYSLYHPEGSGIFRSLLLLVLLSRHKCFTTITITISNSLTTLLGTSLQCLPPDGALQQCLPPDGAHKLKARVLYVLANATLDKKLTYARTMFIDFSSAFNTI